MTGTETFLDQPAILKNEINAFKIDGAEDLEQFRIRFLGSKNILKSLFSEISKVPNERKKEFGQLVNELKQMAETRYKEYKEILDSTAGKSSKRPDLSLPVVSRPLGSRHPLSIVRNEIVRIFNKIGFTVADGPEIEDDWHNFTALNIPENHPARDMQDTFFVQKDPDIVLRTHTSPVQIRTLMKTSPPIRVIAPGRVYRCDNDATHSPVFHQVEGIYIDKKVSFADLKKCLYHFVEQVFGEKTKVRFRPSYFPFTEPSAEMDIGWEKNGEFQWMEILGCGMVDPAVLKNCNIDPDQYSGFAFGMGIERIAMLKYGIRDIRLFYENDLRFLSQFTGAE